MAKDSVQISVRLPAELYKQIVKESKKMERSISNQIVFQLKQSREGSKPITHACRGSVGGQ